MDDREKIEEEELSEEEMAELMTAYKKELARIYKTASAKKTFMARQRLPNLQQELARCDAEMREDIEAMKHKYGIHY